MNSLSFGTWIRRVLTAGLPLLVAAAPLAAQDGTIRGRVVSETGLQPLVNVQVSLVNRMGSTLTDEEGRYVLSGVPAGPAVVRARSLGFAAVTRSVTVEAGETVTVNFTLAESAIALDELVVTATGQQRNRELANAVGIIDVEQQLQTAPANNLMNVLQSRIPGVVIRQGSGSVGAASGIKIRGNTSLGLDNTPLVYVDGARIDNSNDIGAGVGGQSFTRLNDLNPDDIASIEVVKGPAAATLYGTEASAGVIRITTHRGSAGEPIWNARMEQGVSWDPVDWWEMAWNPARGAGIELFFGVPAAVDTTYTFSLLEGDQFFDSPFETGHQQSYGLSVRGGAEDLTYFVSGDYTNSQGILRSNSVERYNARANVDLQVSDDLRINVSNGFVSSESALPESDNSLFSIVGNALGTPWRGGLLRADPVTGGDPIRTCFIAFELSRSAGVPLADATDSLCSSPYFVPGENSMDKIQELVARDETSRYTGSLTATHQAADWWTNRATIGYDDFSSGIRNIFPVDPDRPFGDLSEGQIIRTDRRSSTLTLEGSSAAVFDLTPELRSTTTVGVQYNQNQTDVTFATGRRFPAGSPSVGNSVENEADDDFFSVRTIGLFIQEQLGWRDRLFLIPAVRFDDNSAFGEELGIQTYPRIGVSWVMSEEEWFPDFFDQFRLRGSWGQSGRQPGPDDALALLNVNSVSFRAADVLGFTANRPGNPDLKPETGTEVEVGFESSFLSNRLSVEFTYFDKRTEDAIIARPDALSLGFPGNRFVNIGEIDNTGIELAVDADVFRSDDVSFNIRGTLATLDSEVTRLPEPIIIGTQRLQEGAPYGAFFARDVFIDESGDVVVGDDPVQLGQPTPEWEGSIEGRLDFLRHFSLSALFDYKGGHQIENGLERFSCGLFGGGDQFGSCPAIFEVGPDGELTDEARIKDRAAAVGSAAPFIYDADFVRLRNISLGITVPERWLGSIGASRASVTFSGENLAIWTDYPGTDPEANFAGPAQVTSQQLWTLPQVSRFSTRFTLTF